MITQLELYKMAIKNQEIIDNKKIEEFEKNNKEYIIGLENRMKAAAERGEFQYTEYFTKNNKTKSLWEKGKHYEFAEELIFFLEKNMDLHH